jgi:hypothetical protein
VLRRTPPAQPEGSPAIYYLDTSGYYEWTAEDRVAVESWLREHDIDPKDVPVGDGVASPTVHILPSGERELRMWVFDRQDGSVIRCPTCPSCPRRKRVTRIVKTALPSVAGAYVAPDFTLTRPS